MQRAPIGAHPEAGRAATERDHAAMEIGGGVDRDDRLEVGRAGRRRRDGGDAGIRRHPHPHLAVAPWLARNPLDHGVAVAAFLRRERLGVAAAGTAEAAQIDGQPGIAARGKVPVERLDVKPPAAPILVVRGEVERAGTGPCPAGRATSPASSAPSGIGMRRSRSVTISRDIAVPIGVRESMPPHTASWSLRSRLLRDNSTWTVAVQPSLVFLSPVRWVRLLHPQPESGTCVPGVPAGAAGWSMRTLRARPQPDWHHDGHLRPRLQRGAARCGGGHHGGVAARRGAQRRWLGRASDCHGRRTRATIVNSSSTVGHVSGPLPWERPDYFLASCLGFRWVSREGLEPSTR